MEGVLRGPSAVPHPVKRELEGEPDIASPGEVGERDHDPVVEPVVSPSLSQLLVPDEREPGGNAPVRLHPPPGPPRSASGRLATPQSMGILPPPEPDAGAAAVDAVVDTSTHRVMRTAAAGQVVAGLVADVLGAATAAALAAWWVDGDEDVAVMAAGTAGLSFIHAGAMATGIAVLFDSGLARPAGERLAIWSTLLPTLATGGGGGLLAATTFWFSADHDLFIALAASMLARSAGFLAAESTLQLLDRFTPKAQLELPPQGEGEGVAVEADVLRSVIAPSVPLDSHLAIGLLAVVAGFAAAEAMRERADLGPQAGSLSAALTARLLAQAPVVLARAFTRVDHAVRAARAVDASGLRVRLVGGAQHRGLEAWLRVLKVAGARTDLGGSTRDAMSLAQGLSRPRSAGWVAAWLAGGLSEQLGQVGTDLVDGLPHRRGDLDRHLESPAEGGDGLAPAEFLQRYDARYGGTVAGWVVQPRPEPGAAP